MGIYDRPRATAKRLLTKYGQLVTWRVITDGTLPDATKPWLAGTPNNTDKNVRIAFFSLSANIPHEIRTLMHYAKNSEIFTGENWGLMPVYDFVPSMNDVVIRNGLELRISAIDPLQVNEEAILYAVGFTQ